MSAAQADAAGAGAGAGVGAALTGMYRRAVAAVAPGPALTRRLDRVEDLAGGRIHVLAAGKAAPGMARAAASWLERRGPERLRGLVVAPNLGPDHAATTDPAPGLVRPASADHAGMPPGFRLVVGDHPLPGPRSAAAAREVGAFMDGLAPGDDLWVLLSGGATSLLAAPVAWVARRDLVALFRALGGAGLDIHSLNAVRKRFLRWGAGRLAEAAAARGARLRTYAVSDVPGDLPAAIGSGPTVADEVTIGGVLEIIEAAGLAGSLPPTVEANIAGIVAGRIPETPKPGAAALADTAYCVVAANADARRGAAEYAAERGWTVTVAEEELAGEAAPAGREIARRMEWAAPPPRGGEVECLIWGGETVVALGGVSGRALGGRCQELALAAAEVLAGGGPAAAAALLAAGTDGRDGPTDAAGALVSAATWPAIEAAGRIPAADLAGHDAYHALAAAGALFRPGPTGTNVMDIVLALRWDPRGGWPTGAGSRTPG